jgi:hypothetical protein
MINAYRPGIAPECRFIMSNGCRCHAIAVRGMAYCRYHLPAKRRPNAKGRPLRPLRIEFQSVERAAKPVAQIKKAMAQGRIDHPRGELLMYGMQIARQAAAAASGNVAPPISPPPEGRQRI